MEDGTPLLLGLEIDKVLGVEEAGGVGAVIGASGLAHDLGDFREGGHHDARLVGEVDAGSGAFAGRQRAAHPDGAFVEVGQELRADGAAEGEIDGDGEEHAGNADCGAAMLDGRAYRRAIMPREPQHDAGCRHSLAPFLNWQTGQHGRHKHGEAQRAKQCEGHCPGHGLEEPALDCLQREDGQVGR